MTQREGWFLLAGMTLAVALFAIGYLLGQVWVGVAW